VGAKKETPFRKKKRRNEARKGRVAAGPERAQVWKTAKEDAPKKMETRAGIRSVLLLQSIDFKKGRYRARGQNKIFPLRERLYRGRNQTGTKK